MKEYTYSSGASGYTIWHGNEIYARVTGCTVTTLRAMVNALNQIERLVFLNR
jgi:hypothetical protein